MDKWVALNNSAAGRDKIARLLQYLSRAAWHNVETSNGDMGVVDTFKTLEYILSTFRKCK